MTAAHWESYYRTGALTACPTGPDPNYTLELRAVWSEFYAALAEGARLLDIGTGNGAIALIAKETAAGLGRRWEIDGVDLARIDPPRHVAGGATLFEGIRFHGGVAVEQLPFAAATFDAAGGQYVLEYTDVAAALAEVARVLKPGAGAQFVLHHADSLLMARARASLRQSDVVLNETKVYRRLKRYLEAEQRAPGNARRPWQELSTALATLAATGREDVNRHVIDVALDAVPKLLAQRQRLAPGALLLEVDSVEHALRQSIRRINDLLAAGLTEATLLDYAERAAAAGFVDVDFRPQYHATRVLVGWRLRLRRPPAP